jgi:hypothetical protein
MFDGLWAILHGLTPWRPSEGSQSAFPKSGIRLRKPAGFRKAEGFDGYCRKRDLASVMAIRFPIPYPDLGPMLNRKSIKGQGWRFLGRERVQIGGQPAALIQFEQFAGGRFIRKWAGVLGDNESTILILATFPAEQAERFSEPLKRCILSAEPSNEPPPPPGTTIGFRIEPAAGLKLAGEFMSTLGYTATGKMDVPDATQPLFLAGRSLCEVMIADEEEFLNRRLHEVPQLRDIEVWSMLPISADGLNGREAVADALEHPSGRPISVYMAMFFEPKRYYILGGLICREKAADYLPAFREMTRSFKRV